MHKLRWLFVLCFLALPTARANLQLAAPFGDHMVLQRDQPVPVWGWSEPDARVTVAFAGQSVSATADVTGAWHLALAPLATSAAPRDFVVTARNPHSDEAPLTLHDVLVGEVWLCGGQSNMERQLGPRPGQKPIIGWEAEVAAADHPLFRQLYVTQTRAATPRTTVEAAWSVCTPETAIDFTAVGYFFGRDLQAALGGNIPVGILHASWGGTAAEAWTSAEGLASFPEFAATIASLQAGPADEAAVEQRYQAQLDAWFAAHDPGLAPGANWFAANVADQAGDWPTMPLPAMWEDQGHPGFDGLGWFIRTFDLPANWAGYDLVLRLGRVDDVDTTWVNGQKLGTTTGYRTDRRYPVPAALLHSGRNVIAVRVLDTGGGGGIWDPASPLDLAPADGSATALNLTGAWSYQLVANLKTTPFPPLDLRNNASAPTGLFNGMIAPLIPYAMRGVTFYQGEANAGLPDQYRKLLPALINDWRRLWHAPALPFLYVQIAPFREQPPEIREAQLLAWQATPHTAMVVTVDIGDAEDIHPAQKSPVGARLALAARALAYGEAIEYSGPLYRDVRFDGDHAEVHFTHCADGLVAPGGTLRGFTLAGADGVFHPAIATIVDDTVQLTSAEVATPTAVRYAWANVADGNLFNTAGLPASPFRSDHP